LKSIHLIPLPEWFKLEEQGCLKMNTATLKLELLFTDRKQIVEDITRIVSANDLNIVSMEVENKEQKTLIYIETKSSRFSPSHKTIINSLATIADLIEITEIRSMPQEIREKRLKTVIDSISDGIISIDKFGHITTMNRVAKKMLGWNQFNVLGKHLSVLPVETLDLMDCLKGRSFQNIKKILSHRMDGSSFFQQGFRSGISPEK